MGKDGDGDRSIRSEGGEVFCEVEIRPELHVQLSAVPEREERRGGGGSGGEKCKLSPCLSEASFSVTIKCVCEKGKCV